MKMAEENMHSLTLVQMHDHIYDLLKLVTEGIRKGKIKVYPYQLSKLFGMKGLGTLDLQILSPCSIIM